MPRIRVGCSGWHYAHWRGPFYPPGVLREWASWLRSASAGTPAFVFFNNDLHARAVTDATALRALL